MPVAFQNTMEKSNYVVVTFVDKDWMSKMADKVWPDPFIFLWAFLAGLLVLALLSPLINKAVEWLHKKGDTKTADERSALKGMELSWIIARLEQFLFYLAAVAGLQVFGFAVGGWLLLKAMSRYARWGEPIKAADIPELGATTLRDEEHSEFCGSSGESFSVRLDGITTDCRFFSLAL